MDWCSPTIYAQWAIGITATALLIGSLVMAFDAGFDRKPDKLERLAVCAAAALVSMGLGLACSVLHGASGIWGCA